MGTLASTNNWVNVAPAAANLALYAGDTPRLGIILPLDLTGWTAHMDIRDASGVILQLSSLNGGLTIEANTGRDEVTNEIISKPGVSLIRMRDLSSLEEATIQASTCKYDLETRRLDEAITWLRGFIMVEGDITV